MSDIVERLRNSQSLKDFGLTCFGEEAADEIERLRAELADAAAWETHLKAALAAERERCARVVEDFEIDHYSPYRALIDIADAIRKGEP